MYFKNFNFFLIRWMYRVNKREAKHNSPNELTDSSQCQSIKTNSQSDIEKQSASDNNINGMIVESMDQSDLNPAMNSFQRIGSKRPSNAGFVNKAFDDSEGITVLDETLEIVRELPALHIEHCKL